MRSSEQLTAEEWLPVFESLAGRVRSVVGPLLGTSEGRSEVGTVGAGGDRTMEVDRRAEEVAITGLRELASRGQRFSILSEEAGLINLGAAYPCVVLDPIDGSPNAARGL